MSPPGAVLVRSTNPAASRQLTVAGTQRRRRPGVERDGGSLGLFISILYYFGNCKRVTDCGKRLFKPREVKLAQRGEARNGGVGVVSCDNTQSGQTKHHMTTQPQNATPVSNANDTERVVHDFVRDAVSHLSEKLKDSVAVWEDDSRWERGSDGHFRESKKRMRKLWPMLSDEWLSSLQDYGTCVDYLKSDVVVGPHLDRLVGTKMSASRLEANNILKSLMHAMLDDDGRLAFTEERFDGKWREFVSLFQADRIACKMVSPLPYLVLPAFPLRLNQEIVLDRLNDDEVTPCCQVGVIRPDSLRFPLIYGQIAVGIRKTMYLPKLIRRGDEPQEPPDAGGEGSFGNRPPFRDDLVIDDVLSALRLFKHGQIRTAGLASWTDSFWSGGTSYRVLGQWPYWGKFELSEVEIPRFLGLWRLLEGGAARFGFSIHRFNLAFDRGLLGDRIVDLVIAAEALFLGDLDVHDRGELRFRFALRAAKFIEHPSYNELEIFRVMRRAYDARSAIVHGGSPKDTSLPDNQSADLLTFIDAIEELVRLALRKGLAMTDDGKKLRQAHYWDELLFLKPD